MDEFLTVDEVAALLKISAFKVREYARQGKLPGCKVGKAWRFKREDISKWFNGKKAELQQPGCDNCRHLDTCPAEYHAEQPGWCDKWEKGRGELKNMIVFDNLPAGIRMIILKDGRTFYRLEDKEQVLRELAEDNETGE